MRKYQPGEVKRDARAAEALRSLGYVAGPGPTAGSEENLKDPKDMVDIEQSFRWAESLLARQRPAEVIEHMEPAAQRSPESFLIVELLGKAYAAEELFDFAELAFGQALALQPRSPETWGLLAQVLGVRRAYGRAIKACEQALQIDPEALDAQRLLPQLRELLAQQTAQIDKLRAELRAQPDSAELAFALGDELAVAGATAEAVTVLRTGLEHNPQNIQLANNLAWIMATSPDDHLRNGAEALRLAQVACAGESATNPTILDTLAAAQAETRDFDAAVATLQRAADLARQAGNTHLAAELAQRTKYYQEKRPFRAPA